MSEESDQDRTEEASEKRLREAREKGELPRSRELSTGVVVLAGVSSILATRDDLAMHARNIMMLGVRYNREDLYSADGISHVLSTAALEALRMLDHMILRRPADHLHVPTTRGQRQLQCHCHQGLILNDEDPPAHRTTTGWTTSA